MSTLTISVREEIDQILELVRTGIEAWAKAGERLCALIDNDPDTVDDILKQIPELNRDVLLTLERIGRRQLVPELAIRKGPGWSRLARTQYEHQKKYLDKPVELLVTTEKGPDVLRVPVGNLSAAQARQIIADDGQVRDIAAQRAWLASQVKYAEPEELKRPWHVSGKGLTITRPCKLTMQEIGMILTEMR
jgi:hypothetical protein